MTKNKNLWPNGKKIHGSSGRKISKTKLKLELHALVKQIVLARDPICRICGKRASTTPYHLIPRSFLAVTWDLRNVIGSCVGCNFAEKNNRILYQQKHREIFGVQYYDELLSLALAGKKWSMWELQTLRDALVGGVDMGNSANGELK